MSKGFQLAGGATVIALLLAWFAWAQLEEGSFSYYSSLEEFVASEAAHQGERARVHGYVVEGSILRDVTSQQVAFSIQSEPPHAQKGAEARPDEGPGAPQRLLPVVFASLETPDLFKDGAEVVVEGRAVQVQPLRFRFDADKVMAKCPSKFEGVETARNAPPG